MYIQRFYDDLDKKLIAGIVLVIYGPRQVGKTTLVDYYLKNNFVGKYKFDSGERINLRHLFESKDVKLLLEYCENYDLIVIDEAQKIANIGEGLKLIVDNMPNLKLIVTGLSSFELAGQIGEPLTGRKKTVTLFPVSVLELSKEYNNYELKEKLPELLVYGSYPEIFKENDFKEKQDLITDLMESYLLKDILELDKIKSSKILVNLLRMLSYQIGSEVSLSELGQKLSIDSKTVSRYIDLLEKSFVIFSLSAFSRNLRKEIVKKNKYYFYDLGIRNALIANFNKLELRNDVGQLWENFLIIERIKKQHYTKLYANNYFWRTWSKQEIDWIEERDGNIFAYEFKWSNKQKAKIPSQWLEGYPNSEFIVINNENYLEFISQ